MWFVLSIIIILKYSSTGKAYYIEAVQQQSWDIWIIGIGAKIHSLNWTNDNGGVWLRPFRGDMLRLPEQEPQVHNITFNIIAMLHIIIITNHATYILNIENDI